MVDDPSNKQVPKPAVPPIRAPKPAVPRRAVKPARPRQAPPMEAAPASESGLGISLPRRSSDSPNGLSSGESARKNESTMAYDLSDEMRSALSSAYERRLAEEAKEAAGVPAPARSAMPPRRPTPALGIPNPASSSLPPAASSAPPQAVAPRRRAKVDRTMAFDSRIAGLAGGDSSTAKSASPNATAAVADEAPATQAYNEAAHGQSPSAYPRSPSAHPRSPSAHPRSPSKGIREASKTLAYANREELDRAIEEATNAADATSDLKRTMAYSLSEDQLRAARQEAQATVQAQANQPPQPRVQTSAPRVQTSAPRVRSPQRAPMAHQLQPTAARGAGTTVPTAKKALEGGPRLAATMAFSAGELLPAEEPTAEGDDLRSTIAFSAVDTAEANPARPPHQPRRTATYGSAPPPAAGQKPVANDLSSTLVAGMGPAEHLRSPLMDSQPPTGAPDTAATQLSQGVAPTASPQHATAPLLPTATTRPSNRPPTPIGLGAPAAAAPMQPGGYPAPPAGATGAQPTTVLPERGAFVRQTSSAPPQAELMTVRPPVQAELTTQSDRGTLIAIVVVAVVAVAAMLGGAMYWLMM